MQRMSSIYYKEPLYPRNVTISRGITTFHSQGKSRWIILWINHWHATAFIYWALFHILYLCLLAPLPPPPPHTHTSTPTPLFQFLAHTLTVRLSALTHFVHRHLHLHHEAPYFPLRIYISLCVDWFNITCDLPCHPCLTQYQVFHCIRWSHC